MREVDGGGRGRDWRRMAEWDGEVLGSEWRGRSGEDRIGGSE